MSKHPSLKVSLVLCAIALVVLAGCQPADTTANPPSGAKKVATYEGRVIDAFYVRDSLGRKVTDPEQVQEIASAVSTRLGGQGS